ncbi:hypothetical protein N7447_006867 [Penicillium robsamsonii]|uniref:uncharacterized protein n=1 Tax=Penicillium robsamsonii TaxID=1792511 RepID=UPI002548D669|nr:uncharacterized protein N7447_006867 [Penicillium robsamsonii]KAJ5824527.1 hypothetical protein N7447_006867 [Penicillium robsamsonii]
MASQFNRILAILGVSALLIVTPVNANGCYGGGETWGDVADNTDIFNAMNGACASFAGTFSSGQTKSVCSQFPKGDRANWVVTNNQGDSQTLLASDCVAAMTIEINACSHGSEQQHGDFHYQNDPNAGNC